MPVNMSTSTILDCETKTVNLLAIEHDEIHRYLYEVMAARSSIGLLGISSRTDISSIRDLVATSRPDVLLVGTRKLESDLIEELGKIRNKYSGLGVVMVFSSYRAKEVGQLRQLALCSQGGIAIFLRQSLGQLEQFVSIINAAARGQIILDPALSEFIFAREPGCPFLKQLTPKEVEILNLLANAYTNDAIAKTLYIDVKTVEHHLNNIYGKLRAEGNVDNKHLRVEAARLFIREAGELVKAQA